MRGILAVLCACSAKEATTFGNITNSDALIPLEDYFEYRDRNQTFSSLAAQFAGWPGAVRTADGESRMIPVTPVSANFFSTVDVPAAMGRLFGPGDITSGRGRHRAQ